MLHIIHLTSTPYKTSKHFERTQHVPNYSYRHRQRIGEVDSFQMRNKSDIPTGLGKIYGSNTSFLIKKKNENK